MPILSIKPSRSNSSKNIPGLTPDESLVQFRKILFEQGILHDSDSIGTDDSTLARFLRARKYNLKDATKMFKDCQHWRKTVEGVGIDELYRTLDPFDYPERDEVFKSWPMWFHKTDKKGRPLNVHFFGGMNLPELYKHISPEHHWQTVLVNCESLTREILPAASREAGRKIEQTFVIVDLKGFGLSQFWQVKNLAQGSFQVSQDYFPETMGQLAIVNAPSSFTAIWSIMKPWLAKETVSKIDILGSDYQEVLLRQIDKENLPASLGGECTCEGEGGCDHSFAGPWKEDKEERRARRRREAEGSADKHDEAKVEAVAAGNGDHPSEEKVPESKDAPAPVPIEKAKPEVIPEYTGEANGEIPGVIPVPGQASVPQESAGTVDPKTTAAPLANPEPIEKPQPVPAYTGEGSGEIPGKIPVLAT